MTEPVVVGVDGSPASLAAARHAAHATALRSAPLRLVHGYLHPFEYGIPIDPYAMQLPPPDPGAAQMLEELAGQLRSEWPDLSITLQQAAGGGAVTLIDESLHAQLLVVGSRGRGGFTGLLLGSVSAQVAAHAHCPVLVIRPADAPIDASGPVVVGVDRSKGSEPALALAADEAARRKKTLSIVHAWSVDTAPAGRGYAETEAAATAAATAVITDAVADVRRAHPSLTIDEHLIHALDPETVLIEMSQEASIMVAGSRGRGGFTGLLLGSVSQALVHHAHCPVLIAHPRGHRS